MTIQQITNKQIYIGINSIVSKHDSIDLKKKIFIFFLKCHIENDNIFPQSSNTTR